MYEAMAAVLFGHCGKRRRIGNTCGVFVAEKFHRAAQWDSGHFPAGAMAIIEAKKLGPGTYRKNEDANTASAGNHEVAEFVEDHHERQDEQKRNQGAEHAAPQRVDSGQKIDIPQVSSA